MMTQSDIQKLFTTYSFSDAKRILAENLEKEGFRLTGNETIFELKSLCQKTFQNEKEATPVLEEENDPPESENDPQNKAECTLAGGTSWKLNENQNPEGGESQEQEQEQEQEQKHEQNGQNAEQENPVNPTEEAQHPQPQVDPPQVSQEQEQPTQTRRRRKKVSSEPENIIKSLMESSEAKSKKAELLKQQMENLISEADAERRAAEEERRRQENEKRLEMQSESQSTDNLNEVVKRLKALGKAFLVGPAGTGKSTLAMQACGVIFGIPFDEVAKSKKFAQISFSPDTISADMIGFTDVNGVFHETDIIRVFREGGLVLFDEMDDADASILVKLNTMLSNGVIPTPNGIVTMNPETYIVGTANTYGRGGNSMYCGRSRLDASTLDRWNLATINVQYDTKLEDGILETIGERDTIDMLKAARDVIRSEIERNKFKQVCSTRFIIDSVKMAKSGYSVNQILNTYFLGWDENSSKSVRSKVASAIRRT